MRRNLAMLALATVVPVMLSACGDDGGSSSEDEGESTSTEAPVALEGTLVNEGEEDIGGNTTVDVDAVDNAFAPTFVKARAGAEVTVTVENTGENEHTFTIDDQDVDLELNSGDTAEATVTLPDDEGLRFYCEIHESQGMQGAFYSQDGQTVIGVSNSPDSEGGSDGGGYGY
jgi:plastocyanin